ncbi:AcrR family transcriptional regulator [Paenibacillus endophyticus]|uniref:AcrR family transcriptional regulator n=1 Tax=Paenibacillus endophyticus TaxID=1294268 RepID=A0A7W5C6Z7_9BACL|nr:TetR/AcrR family transcriptional regulator [Paenibacillus endophyticus]MBB3151890.1 AcrR family transcriptional regulator [Paenibacillus endophyticus]
MDRRIKKNQTAIMNALIHLMASKDFEKITINEIAEYADVNRGTIYSHYIDKYDLLDKCIEVNIEQLIDSCLPENPADAYPSKHSLRRTFELMEKNAFFYKTLLTNKGVPSFRNHLQEMMIQGIREQIVDHHLSLNELQKDILVQFLSSATVGVIEWWLTHEMPCSSEEITEHLWVLLETNQVIPRLSI